MVPDESARQPAGRSGLTKHCDRVPVGVGKSVDRFAAGKRARHAAHRDLEFVAAFGEESLALQERPPGREARSISSTLALADDGTRIARRQLALDAVPQRIRYREQTGATIVTGDRDLLDAGLDQPVLTSSGLLALLR
ncbi:MAG: hypothetical protein MSC31_10550 [Solirubrobacteraceae bacterium MAG38_C4-C5]|nr:hypothetical protein [Candidatus Siliceabacter maunaloa]